MILTNYINDLLYRYDCVIIPDFGGFVTNTISAEVNRFSYTFYPPTKQIIFNSHLKNNDGLLANYIANSENISFEEATDNISTVVKNWKQQIETESLVIGKIGSLSLNKHQKLTFEPNKNTNYLIESFGLKPFSSPEIKRIEQKKQVHNLSPVASGGKKEFSFVKYAAVIAVFLTLGGVLWNNYNQQQQREIVVEQQKVIEQKIQSATFVIDNPLPTIELNLTKERTKNFHIIVGSFQFPKNAQKKLLQLKSKRFDSKILGKNKWGLTQVSSHSFYTRREAIKVLKKIRREYSEDAWLLIKSPN